MATTVTPRMAVYKHLLETPEVTALVEDRIFHQKRPDGADYPCIVISTDDDVDRRDLSGVAWTETRLRITAMATTLTPSVMLSSSTTKCLTATSDGSAVSGSKGWSLTRPTSSRTSRRSAPSTCSR